MPAGIDPGFDFNPGLCSSQTLQALSQQKQQAAIPALAKAAEMDGLTVESAADLCRVGSPRQTKQDAAPLPLAPFLGMRFSRLKRPE